MSPLRPSPPQPNRVKLFTADDRPAPFNLQVADLQLLRLPRRAQPTPVTWHLTGGMVLVLIRASHGAQGSSRRGISEDVGDGKQPPGRCSVETVSLGVITGDKCAPAPQALATLPAHLPHSERRENRRKRTQKRQEEIWEEL